jgi:hypothetical protein
MFSQSQIVYEFVAQRTVELAQTAATMDARRLARAGAPYGMFRLLLGNVLISTGQRVQGRKLHGFSPLAPAGGES